MGPNVKFAPHLIGLTSTLAAGLSREGLAAKGGRSADRTGNADWDRTPAREWGVFGLG